MQQSQNNTLPPIDIAIFEIEAFDPSQKSGLSIIGLRDSNFQRLDKFGMTNTSVPTTSVFVSRNMEVIDFISKNRSMFWSYQGVHPESEIHESYSKSTGVVFIRKDIAAKFKMVEYYSKSKKNVYVSALEDPITGKRVIEEIIVDFTKPTATPGFLIKDYLYSSLPKSAADTIVKSRKMVQYRYFKY